MPVDSSGKFNMNPQVSKLHDQAAAPPPMEEAAAPSVTISQTPEGFELVGADGQAQPFASIEEVCAQLQAQFSVPVEEAPSLEEAPLEGAPI